jgi:uncharacterized protein YndB with AHSA1/START domain
MEATRSERAVLTLPSDTQILITRRFAAPPRLVYRAWTTPELVKRWWSGRRGRVTIAAMDLRVGGSWRYVMVTHEGFEVAFHGVYREIVPDERIVSTEIYEAMGGDGVVNTVTFPADGGGTKLELLTQCASREERDMIIDSGMEGGVQEQMEILEEIAGSLR